MSEIVVNIHVKDKSITIQMDDERMELSVNDCSIDLVSGSLF